MWPSTSSDEKNSNICSSSLTSVPYRRWYWSRPGSRAASPCGSPRCILNTPSRSTIKLCVYSRPSNTTFQGHPLARLDGGAAIVFAFVDGFGVLVRDQFLGEQLGKGRLKPQNPKTPKPQNPKTPKPLLKHI